MIDLSSFEVELYFDRNGSYVAVRITILAESKDDAEFCLKRMYPNADMILFA